MTSERDGLAKERETLQEQVADLQAHSAELEKTVADQDRQLTQAREEGSRQQTRAQTAEALSSILAQVIEIDDQIHQEYFNFLDTIDAMDQAFRYGDQAGYLAAYEQSLETAARLDGLFQQRQLLLDQLQ